MRNFWINADDYGECLAVDSAIKTCFELGVVQTCSALSTLMDYTSINSLKELQDKGLYVGLHLDLVQGKPLSSEMSRLLGQDSFPGKTFWADFPSEFSPVVYAEFKAQYEFLKDNRINIVNLSYHTVFPFLFHKEAWHTYVKFAADYKLPFRGLSAKSRYASNIKLLRAKNLQLLAKCIKHNPAFIGNIFQVLLFRPNGTFETDLSLYKNEQHTLEILRKVVADNKEIEILVHLVDPEIEFPSNLDMPKQKSLQFSTLKSQEVLDFLRSLEN